MSGERILVTGCNGFAGRWLSDYLIGEGCQVSGIDVQPVPADARIEYFSQNLAASQETIAIIERAAPKYIFHLAAIANPREAREQALHAFSISVLSTGGILEAARRLGSTRVLVVGSSEQYRKKTGDTAIYTEADSIDAGSIYGASKVLAETMVSAYVNSLGVDAVFTRSFNHSGPGQAPVYVLSDFARQCAMIKHGLQEPRLVTGNIDLCRDFLDVRDVVKAYDAIMRKGRQGVVYNVASGKAYSLRSLIQSMLGALELDKVDICVDPARLRSGEPATIVGDITLIQNDTGWSPVKDIHETVAEMARYWFEQLGRERKA